LIDQEFSSEQPHQDRWGCFFDTQPSRTGQRQVHNTTFAHHFAIMHSTLRSRTAALLALLLVFTGCITIEENYAFKKDGSGTMEYVVDMSELGEMLKTFEDMGKNDPGGSKGDMSGMDLKDEMAALKSVPGIKKVKVNDKEKFKQKLSFQFADITALNAALNVLMKDSTNTSHTFFTWEGRTLVRTNNDHARQIGSGMGKQEDPADTTDMTQVLEMMKYNYSFAFADAITGVEMASGVEKEEVEPRKVKLHTNFNVIGNDPKALDLRIDLQKP